MENKKPKVSPEEFDAIVEKYRKRTKEQQKTLVNKLSALSRTAGTMKCNTTSLASVADVEFTREELALATAGFALQTLDVLKMVTDKDKQKEDVAFI